MYFIRVYFLIYIYLMGILWYLKNNFIFFGKRKFLFFVNDFEKKTHLLYTR